MASIISATATRGAGPTAARHSPMTDTGRRALLRIGDALRSDRAYRLRLRRRGSAIAVLIGALGLTLAAPIRPLLVWNATPSAPVGLYAVSAPHDVEKGDMRSKEHTSELQSLMRISYAVFCLKKKK